MIPITLHDHPPPTVGFFFCVVCDGRYVYTVPVCTPQTGETQIAPATIACPTCRTSCVGCQIGRTIHPLTRVFFYCVVYGLRMNYDSEFRPDLYGYNNVYDDYDPSEYAQRLIDMRTEPLGDVQMAIEWMFGGSHGE